MAARASLAPEATASPIVAYLEFLWTKWICKVSKETYN